MRFVSLPTGSDELDYIDPEWVRTTIVPWFDLEHPASESAWNSFLYDNWHQMTNRLPKPELFSLIKSDFLAADCSTRVETTT